MNDDDQGTLCGIARCAFKVINRLLSRDQLLARDLRSDQTGSRQIYREECITVEMATELRVQFPGHVEIELFTPPEEARTGADWYWLSRRVVGLSMPVSRPNEYSDRSSANRTNMGILTSTRRN